MQIRQQLWIVLQVSVRLLWLVVRQIWQWLLLAATFVYQHRRQIVQYRYTVPLLILFSVVWAVWQYDPSSAESMAVSTEEAQSVAGKSRFTATRTAQLLPRTTGNQPLRNSIADWIGTPHRSGMESKSGTDCSGFVRAVFRESYGLDLSRNSEEMFRYDVKPTGREELREGDLVFFNTYGKGITHVGIYLCDDKFVHASTSRGVIIDSLGSPYYQKNYYAAGRVIRHE